MNRLDGKDANVIVALVGVRHLDWDRVLSSVSDCVEYEMRAVVDGDEHV
jgi:hypothetical protein